MKQFTRHRQASAIPGRVRTTALAVLASVAAVASLTWTPSAGADDPAPSSAVRPIDWASFTAGSPESAGAELSRRILLNANRYALQSWFPDAYGAQTGEYLDLGGTAEEHIRPPGSEALALAASLATGIYDTQVTGVPVGQAQAVAVRLVTSIAHHHLANADNGWGDHWQSALWAYYAGFAAWLLWENLDVDDRENVRRMIEHEADRFIGYDVPYFRDAHGDVAYPGDSKAEENAWNANVLQLATAMMPTHPRRGLWMAKNLELMVSAFSRPADLESTEVVNGRQVRDWLNGSNIADDGTLVNHGFVHPDYMATAIHNTSAVLAYGLANMSTPEAALFNADLVYEAMVNHEFASPPYDAPGGTIYVDGSADLYYPQGNDWGTHRRMHVALMDAQASLFGLDRHASTPGSEWEPLHASMVLDMQSRFPDGRTYGAPTEDTYAGREQWVAVHAAQHWLTHWVVHQGGFTITERAYPPVDGAHGSVDVAAGNVAGAGSVIDVTAEWRVGVPADAPAGRADLGASARFRAFGQPHTAAGSVTIVVPPPPPSGTAYLSDHPWADAHVGYPRDGSGTPLRDENLYGDPLTIEDEVFAHGLFAHAASSITFHLGGACSRLTALVGIDDAVEADGPAHGSVAFHVRADGTMITGSGVMRGDDEPRVVDVDLSGVRHLELVATDGGDGISHDHAVWADPVITCSS